MAMVIGVMITMRLQVISPLLSDMLVVELVITFLDLCGFALVLLRMICHCLVVFIEVHIHAQIMLFQYLF